MGGRQVVCTRTSCVSTCSRISATKHFETETPSLSNHTLQAGDALRSPDQAAVSPGEQSGRSPGGAGQRAASSHHRLLLLAARVATRSPCHTTASSHSCHTAASSHSCWAAGQRPAIRQRAATLALKGHGGGVTRWLGGLPSSAPLSSDVAGAPLSQGPLLSGACSVVASWGSGGLTTSPLRQWAVRDEQTDFNPRQQAHPPTTLHHR